MLHDCNACGMSCNFLINFHNNVNAMTTSAGMKIWLIMLSMP